MFVLKLLFKLEGTRGVDTFLKDNISYLNGLKPSDLDKFYHMYLSYPFDCSKENPFKIFDYIKIKMIHYYNGLIESNYCETMPSSYIIDALKYINIDAIDFSEFVNYMISRLNEENVLRLPEIKNLLKLCGPLPALNQKLRSCKNIDLVISLYPVLDVDDTDILVNNICDNYSLDDIKKFALSLNIDSMDYVKKIIMLLVENNRTKDALDIINSVDNKNNFKDDYDVFLSFVEMFKFENPEEEYMPLLAEEILKSNNIRLMYYWVININCDYNYKIIDKLLIDKNIDLSKLVLDLADNYSEYVVRKICENEELEVLEGFIKNMFKYIDKKNINKISNILGLISNLKPTYKLSKDLKVILLRYDFEHFHTYIEKQIYTKVERLQILNNLYSNNAYDLIAIYGAYLLSGDKTKLVREEIANTCIDSLKRLRETKK